MSERYRLRWNNHQNNMINIFHTLLKREAFTDVTLAVENRTIKCHKLILAACSPYLQRLLEESPCKHPTIILNNIKYADLKIVLDFMYNGEVNVMQEQLTSLLMTAEVLKVKGLVDTNNPEERHTELQFRDMSPTPGIDADIISTSTSRDTVMASSSSGPSSPPHSTLSDMYKYSQARDFSRYGPAWQTSLHTLPDYSAAACQSSSHHRTSTSSLGTSSSYDHENLSQMKLDTPILRTALGQGHVGSSQTLLSSFDIHGFEDIHLPRSKLNSRPATAYHHSIDLSHKRETVLSPSVVDEEEKRSPRQKEAKSDLPKPEWKRYKQYSRAEIDAAIAAVKEGMSAVQAARKYNVPSRTLYDKVKKLGITRVKRGSTTNGNTSSGSTFYDADDNLNGGVYSTQTAPPEGESACNVKKIRQDHETTMDPNARSVTSPVIRYATQMQQLSIEDKTEEKYEVEDLSMSSRKFDQVSDPYPSTPDLVKEEMLDAALSSDSDQN